MSCIQPMLVRNKNGQIVRVPCGKCYGCLRRKQRELALRLSYDLENAFDSVFVTLTYDDEHLERDILDEETGAFYPMPSVQKSTLQKFFKRLRKLLDYDSRRTSLYYYATGEYGDETKRPHYHAIIYMLGTDTCKLPLAVAVERCWRFCNWDMVNREKCIQSAIGEGAKMYVAKHQVKKCQGTYLQAPYFQLRSKGIGKTFLDNKIETEFAINNGFLYYDRTKKAPIPRYYKDKLGIERTDGDVRKDYLEELAKEEVAFENAWRYYKQSHPNVTREEFVRKYFKKLVHDMNYAEEYSQLMYKKLKNSKI